VVREPLRILDCKRPECRGLSAGAPKLRDALCKDCRLHFAAVLDGLDRLAITYEEDDYLVRGLDYYTRTTFSEYGSDVLEGVGGGGRYDGLVPRSVARRCPASASERASSGSCSHAMQTASFLPVTLGSAPPRRICRGLEPGGDRARAHP